MKTFKLLYIWTDHQEKTCKKIIVVVYCPKKQSWEHSDNEEDHLKWHTEHMKKMLRIKKELKQMINEKFFGGKHTKEEIHKHFFKECHKKEGENINLNHGKDSKIEFMNLYANEKYVLEFCKGEYPKDLHEMKDYQSEIHVLEYYGEENGTEYTLQPLASFSVPTEHRTEIERIKTEQKGGFRTRHDKTSTYYFY